MRVRSVVCAQVINIHNQSALISRKHAPDSTAVVCDTALVVEKLDKSSCAILEQVIIQDGNINIKTIAHGLQIIGDACLVDASIFFVFLEMNKKWRWRAPLDDGSDND